MNQEDENKILDDFTLPRGCGSVMYIAANKNVPYRARKFSHNDEKGNPRYIIIGSYRTRGEAVKALLDNINKSTLDLKRSQMTFIEIYDIWYKGAAQNLSPETKRVYRNIFRKCAPLHNKVYANISMPEMQEIIVKETSAVVQTRIKSLLSKLDNVADSLDIITKHRSSFVVAAKPHLEHPRTPFTDEEVYRLIEHQNDPYMYVVLILLYTGFRSGELMDIKKTDVDMEKLIIRGGKKTPAGERRIIPIHPRIQCFISQLMEEPGEYLIKSKRGLKQNRVAFDKNFKSAISPYCEREHIPHECRHSFRTRLDSMGANRVCMDLLMGHEPINAGERTYSHKTPEKLREATMLLW